MADNEQDILFRLRTEGDTEGAEQVSEAIQETGDAAKSAGQEAQQADPQLQQLINIQRAQVATQIASALGKVGSAVREMAADFKTSDKEFSQTLENTAVGIDSLTGALSGAAQGFAVGGPFGAAIGGLVGLMSGPLKDAYGDMIRDLDAAAQAERRAAEMTRKLKDARQAFADQVRQEKLATIFDDQSDAIEKQVRLIETLARLNAAERGAAGAVQDALQPAATPEQQIARDLNRDLADIDAKVQTAADLAAQAAIHAQDAQQNAIRVSASEGENSAIAIKAAAARDAAIQEADALAAKADELRATREAEQQKIRAAAVEQLAALGDAAGNSITENATSVIRTIQQVAAEQQGRVGADTKGALDQLTKLVGDLIPDEQQTAAFQQAIQQFRGSQDAAQNRLVPAMDEILATNREIIASQAARDAEILRQKREIADSNTRFQEQLQQISGQR